MAKWPQAGALRMVQATAGMVRNPQTLAPAGRVRTVVTSLDSASAERQQRSVPRAVR